jgi:hypothetical protein
MPRPRPRSTAKQGVLSRPHRDALRVVDNVRTTRPDLLLHSREPGGMRMLIEVKWIAFRLRHEQVLQPVALGRGYMDRTPRG